MYNNSAAIIQVIAFGDICEKQFLEEFEKSQRQSRAHPQLLFIFIHNSNITFKELIFATKFTSLQNN